MALYTFVGIFCSFIAVDITKFLISKKASGFFYLLNLLAVISLSIILANLLGFIWISIYSEIFIKVWFPDMYDLGQMFIAFFGSSIWMSIFSVPLFHYMHINNKIQFKKWIYSAFLIVIIALPLMTVVLNSKSEEGNLTSVNNKSSIDDSSRYYICHTGFDGIYLVINALNSSISITPHLHFKRETLLSIDESFANPVWGLKLFQGTVGEWGSGWDIPNPNFKIDNQNKVNFISVTNKVSQTSFKLERIKENIFYELKTLFMETEGRCVYLENPDQDEEENFAILKFLKSQGLMNP